MRVYLLILLLMCLIPVSIAQPPGNWFPYNPTSNTSQSIHILTAPGFNYGVYNRTREVKLRFLGTAYFHSCPPFSIVPGTLVSCGPSGLATFYHTTVQGEYWAYADLNINIDWTNSPVPFLYNTSQHQYDSDVFGSTAMQMVPYNVQYLAIYNSIYNSYSFVVPTASQWDGCSFAIDSRLGVIDIPVAYIDVPPNIWGLTTVVQFHVFGNINHSQSGSGWMYLHWEGGITW